MPDAQTTVGSATSSATIDALLQETRQFPPAPEFVAQANVRDPSVYQRALDDPEGFWAQAAERLDWYTPRGQGLEGGAPRAKWVVARTPTASDNSVHRPPATGPR